MSTGELAAEIARGEGLGMAAAARRFPSARSGKPCHPATVTRYGVSGTRTKDGRTVRLEVARCGSRWVTSAAAIERFIAAQQPARDSVTRPRVDDPRQADVERQLNDLGV